MQPYPKIKTVFERNPDDGYKTVIPGKFSQPEFEYLADNPWELTEKIDGTNVRVMRAADDIATLVEFAGKTNNAQMPAFLLARLHEMFTSARFRESFDDDAFVCLYGEGYGARIQKGGGNYIPNGVDFILFDVWVGKDMESGIWLERQNVEDVAFKMGIQSVPVVGYDTLGGAVSLVEAGFQSHVAQQEMVAEGLVMRPFTELADRRGHRIITKIKHKDFVQSLGKTR